MKASGRTCSLWLQIHCASSPVRGLRPVTGLRRAPFFLKSVFTGNFRLNLPYFLNIRSYPKYTSYVCFNGKGAYRLTPWISWQLISLNLPTVLRLIVRVLIVTDLPFPPQQRHLLSAQHIVLNLDANDTIYCVSFIPCGPVHNDRKGCKSQDATVLHFRKVVIRQKIGSHRNGHSLI